MEQAKRSSLNITNPTLLGAVFTVLAGVTLYIAPMQDKNAFVMSPGLEGCLAVGSVGILLALLQGIPYGRVVILAAVIFAIQVFSCWYAREPWAGMLGLELLGLGLVGLVKPVSKGQPDEAEQPSEQVERTAVVTR